MLWGKKTDTIDTTNHSIAQPPPTPGLASWAFNSLFNKQTPSSKYAELAKDKRSKIPSLAKDNYFDNKDDTFYNRKNEQRSRRFNDDSLLNSTRTKNVAWGGDDFRVRTRSSSFSEKPQQNKTDYFKEKELLPDVDDSEFDFTRTRRRSISSSQPNYSSSSYRSEPIPHTSLPQAYPGKFPSPYVPKNSSPLNSNILSSSASRNLKAADYNTQRNKSISAGSPLTERNYKDRPTSNRRSYSRTSVINDYENDHKQILSNIDRNIDELNYLTRNVEELKLEGAYTSSRRYEQLEKKYQDVKQELIDEFKKSKKIYDSYYKFMDKYKQLKHDYNYLVKKSESSDDKKSQYLSEENKLLNRKLELQETKLKEKDNEVFNLKTTLQNTSIFEGTLRRKIKYLEDKLQDNHESFKNERFQLNEKIFLLESKLKDEKESHSSDLRKAQERIDELQKRLDNRSSFKQNDISLLPEYDTRTGRRRSSYDIGKENDPTDYFNDKFSSKRYSSTRDTFRKSPDHYSDEYRRNGKRPTSLQVPSNYKLSDLKDEFAFSRFDKIDESTTTFDFKVNNKNIDSLRGKYSNNSLPDLTFNASEI